MTIEPFPLPEPAPGPPWVEVKNPFHDAQRHAQSWANASGRRKFVVKNAGRYFLADWRDLEVYHRRDIHARRAEVVAICRPISFSLPIDATYAAFGFAE